jgi:hypothetical protein
VKPVAFIKFLDEVLKLKVSPAWRTLIKVAIDRVEPRDLEGEERELARALFGDVEEVPDAARRALVWRLGRGSGKTTLAAALGVWLMLVSPMTAVGPGMTAAVVVVAPGKPTAKVSVMVARELVRRVPSLERLVCDDGDTSEGFSLVRPDRRRVSFVAVAASRGGITLRGYDVLAVIFDESEFFTSNSEVAAGDGFAVSDRDLYAAAKPRLHGVALFISTPWPVENLTAELFDRNHGRPQTALAALGVSTMMRPEDERLTRDVADALAADPDGDASREYLCQVGARGGSRLFDEASIVAALDERRPLVVQAAQGATIGCGGDLGLERDSSAIAVVAAVDGAYELLEFDEVKPSKDAPLSPSYVIRQRFVPVARRHHASGIMMDGHYRQSATEHLEADDLQFLRAPEGAQGKYDSYMHVRALLRTGSLRLPAVPRLVSQLRAVTSKAVPGGGTRISSPRRMGQAHGDVVSALVLACWSARHDSDEPEWIKACETLLRDSAPRPEPITVRQLPNGYYLALGHSPRFSTAEGARFVFLGEATFSERASMEFRAALDTYRSARRI